jgi:DNA-directed RNA polymerase alpha subunit|tara:strand:- start:76 stop:894 length:819 start_codon:yes stop_codon:yes gene_type:complete
MKIKKIYNESNISKYEISQSNTAIVNSLRRVIISEIPTISIQYIKFIENSTHFFAEFISHRVGLIPLIYDGDIMEVKDKKECSCENECELCKFIINVDLKNETNNLKYFTSEDLQFNNAKLSVVKYKNPIPICFLNPGEKIQLECYAFKNIGKNHSRWCAVSGVSFIKKHNVKIIDDNCSVLPRDNYNLVLKGEEVNIRDEFEFIPEDNRGFFKVYDKKKERTKNVNCDIIPTNNYILKIETNGSIDNDTILKMGINILNKKVCDLKNILEG